MIITIICVHCYELSKQHNNMEDPLTQEDLSTSAGL